ncbi:hypothetical protein [uncultured Brevundimonas sp.]|uniref:hypothetical protein n=1 Tax=uncultured Brevundimonas sp. TaxID=213418 RepID=UPI0026315552|nr:hypothetical protein [uncultured Brevundimonas sp.]
MDIADSRSSPLTGLERELLGYVERLTMASETSATQFAELERRSTGQISERLTALEECCGLLLRSQIKLVDAFASLAVTLSGPASLGQALIETDEALREALLVLKSRTT